MRVCFTYFPGGGGRGSNTAGPPSLPLARPPFVLAWPGIYNPPIAPLPKPPPKEKQTSTRLVPLDLVELDALVELERHRDAAALVHRVVNHADGAVVHEAPQVEVGHVPV